MAGIVSENPDVDFARDRLDNLLKNIRSSGNNNQSTTTNGRKSSPRGGGGEDDREGSDYDNNNSDYEDRQASARKRRRAAVQKKIIFELRQKAFEINNTTIEHGLYALCRIWMRGKDNKEGVVVGEPIDRATAPADREWLLAAKAVSRKSTVRPESRREDPTKVTGAEGETAQDILAQYLPRWRKVKRDWCRERSETDAEKYGDSLRVLREMHATAQSHVISI